MNERDAVGHGGCDNLESVDLIQVFKAEQRKQGDDEKSRAGAKISDVKADDDDGEEEPAAGAWRPALRAAIAPLRRSSQRDTGPLAAKIEAATSSSHGTRRMNVICGVFSSTSAPAVPPSSPASPIGHARRAFFRMSSQYAAIEVNCPGQIATVLVALACTGQNLHAQHGRKRQKRTAPGHGVQHPGQKCGHRQPHPVPVHVEGSEGKSII